MICPSVNLWIIVKFAHEVHRRRLRLTILAKPPGKTIYCGGGDDLGLRPGGAYLAVDYIDLLLDPLDLLGKLLEFRLLYY